MTDLDGRIAIVTGASRGLGFAVAEALGKAGAHVIAVARTVGGLEALDEAIGTAGGTATLVPLDITDDPGLERMGAAVHGRWGHVDLWVHAAIHATSLAPVEHIAAGDLDRALAVNLRAPARLIRVIDPLLRAAPAGRAVHFADAGTHGARFHATYLSTKAGAGEVFGRWADEIATTTRTRVLRALPPPMPTALRARFYPGEDRDALTPPPIVAARLLAHLAADTQTEADLRG